MGCNRLRINPLNAELNPICHLLALLGGATIVVVSGLRVKDYKKSATKVCNSFSHTKTWSTCFEIFLIRVNTSSVATHVFVDIKKTF